MRYVQKISKDKEVTIQMDTTYWGRNFGLMVIKDALRKKILGLEDRKVADDAKTGEVVARPHIARVLVDRGFAKSVPDAFERFVGKNAVAYVSRYRPSQEEAIEVIHAAHGAAVMAHPRFWTSDARLLADGLARLKDLGLDGVEAVYQGNLPLETPMHLRIAREAGLAVTAGSDFHGANKPSVTLGVDVGDDEAFLAPFLDALSRRGCHFLQN